jgi:hypothetical protein
VRLVDRALDGAFLAGMTHSHALDLEISIAAQVPVGRDQPARSAAHDYRLSADPFNSRSAHHA